MYRVWPSLCVVNLTYYVCVYVALELHFKERPRLILIGIYSSSKRERVKIVDKSAPALWGLHHALSLMYGWDG